MLFSLSPNLKLCWLSSIYSSRSIRHHSPPNFALEGWLPYFLADSLVQSMISLAGDELGVGEWSKNIYSSGSFLQNTLVWLGSMIESHCSSQDSLLCAFFSQVLVMIPSLSSFSARSSNSFAAISSSELYHSFRFAYTLLTCL